MSVCPCWAAMKRGVQPGRTVARLSGDMATCRRPERTLARKVRSGERVLSVKLRCRGPLGQVRVPPGQVGEGASVQETEHSNTRTSTIAP